MTPRLACFTFLPIFAGCVAGTIEDGGQSVAETSEGLTGCNGTASSAVPASGRYYLTSFGAGSDSGVMSCGQNTNHGSWYYAANRQRYGCGARLKVTAGNKCVVVEADDYGPDRCVENAVGEPILDASPLVSEYLFGTRSAGWSDRFVVQVDEVARSTPLGPCSGDAGPPPQTEPSEECHSSTLDADVAEGTCVQSRSDSAWYQCQGGVWRAGRSGCTVSYPWCWSPTLNRSVPARTCVQSRSNGVWYQCNSDGWDTPVSDGAGPVGTCAAMYSL